MYGQLFHVAGLVCFEQKTCGMLRKNGNLFLFIA